MGLLPLSLNLFLHLLFQISYQLLTIYLHLNIPQKTNEKYQGFLCWFVSVIHLPVLEYSQYNQLLLLLFDYKNILPSLFFQCHQY